MNKPVSTALSELAAQIGSGVEALDFQVHLEGGRKLAAADFDLLAQRIIDFAGLGLHAPAAVRDFWSGEWLEVREGRLCVHLASHASVLVCWS